MTRFDPPGFLDDLNETEKNQWSEIVSGWLDEAQRGNPAGNDGPRRQFFNALHNPPAADAEVVPISWSAFPRQVLNSSANDRQRWRRADSSRSLQDEYCEWSVTRDPATRKITRVTFTCEGPEYWQVLAALNPNKVLSLYREFISPSISMDELFPGGQYNPQNPYNNSTSRGAMHLIQQANTLGAEIELAAAATIRRVRDGVELTDAQALIGCSRYGEAERNSDPHIGEQVNAAARAKHDITLNNPVGLYLADFNPVDWTTPNGRDPKEFWKFVRGKEGHYVRAIYEVPPGEGYVVGDIRISGQTIDFGAQIADFITIKLEGLITRKGASLVQPVMGCRLPSGPLGVEPAAGILGAAGGVGPAPAPPATVRPSRAVPARVSPADQEAAEQALFARLPAPLRETGASLPPDALPPEFLVYPRLPDALFVKRQVSGRILAYASPDSTFAVTRKLIDSAQHTLVIGIYDFNADYVKEPLKDAMRRGVSVSLMLDVNNADDPGLFNELRALGARCVRAPSSSAGSSRVYFNNAHEKIICVDGSVVMIQSGNWSENSIPFNEGDGLVVNQYHPGNRDMGLAVQSTELTRFFAELVARDMRLAEGLPPDAVPPDALGLAQAADGGQAAAEFFELAPSSIPQLFPSLTVIPTTPVAITPAVTPENFDSVAKALLRTATRSIRLEQQYIRATQPAIRTLLALIQEACNNHPELTVQIIVSPKYLSRAERQTFLDAMEEFDLFLDDNIRFLSAEHFVHCHNKLIIVDDEKVLLGSQNWSTTGVLSNREAGLLVEHAGIAGYFAQIFDSDWALSEPQVTPPDAVLGATPGVATSTDFATGGVVISRTRDYQDV